MIVTARQLNRATLARQLLLHRESLDAVEAVHRVVALQAQQPESPYLALWNRLTAFDPANLERAFVDRRIVKASLMRIALHAVDAVDYPAFHEAMQPTLRGSCLTDPRFTVTGLSLADLDDLVPEVLEFADRPRTNADVHAWLDRRLGVLPRPGVWWAMRRFAPFVHAPTGGPWSFSLRPSYIAVEKEARPGDPDAALPSLVFRYLEGFGPATIQDIGRFAMVHRSRVRAALRSRVRAALRSRAGGLVMMAGPDGGELFDVPGGPLPPEDSPAPPRLLPMWDNILLAYDDRSRIIPPDYRRLVTRNNGDVLPTLLIDGYVAGVWRPLDGGIEATAFHPLSAEAWSGLETEASALIAFLADREPAIYGRYAHWWKAMPHTERRLLGR